MNDTIFVKNFDCLDQVFEKFQTSLNFQNSLRSKQVLQISTLIELINFIHIVSGSQISKVFNDVGTLQGSQSLELLTDEILNFRIFIDGVEFDNFDSNHFSCADVTTFVDLGVLPTSYFFHNNVVFYDF